jgi:L-fuculose-phosphate aldolase
LLVTPSGIPASELADDDLVLLDADGTPAREGQRAPTSEWQLHSLIARRRPDATAIVHTHSPEATAAASVAELLPSVHYVVARFGGGGLRRAPYATYGTEALATNVTDTLAEDADACLMANHGAIAIGADLDAAVALALDVEWFCGVVRRATQLGTPTVLDATEIDRVADRFGTYGQHTS